MNLKKSLVTIFFFFLAVVIISAGSVSKGAAEKCTPNSSPSGSNTMTWSCSKPNGCTSSGLMTTSESSATRQATCDLFGKIFPGFAGKNITGGGGAGKFAWTYWGSVSQEYSDETDVTTVILKVKENKNWGRTTCFKDNNESYCVPNKRGTWDFNGSGGGQAPTIDLLVNGSLFGAGGAITVPVGENAVLKWTSHNSTSCSATQGAGSTPAPGATSWNGGVDLNNSSNSKYVYTINDDIVFGIRCCDISVSPQCVSDEVTVLAGTGTEPTDPNLPSCDFGAEPSEINKGEKSTLSWVCRNANKCALKNQSGFSVVNFPPASTSTDSHDVSPRPSKTKTYTYTLNCSNSFGSRSYEAPLDVIVSGGGGQFPGPIQHEAPPGN